MSLFSHHGQLLLLSDEILVEILSFLTSGLDLFHCSQTCSRLQKLVQDKKVLKMVSFRRQFGVTGQNFKQFFTSSSVCTKIEHINLNSIYWLNLSLLYTSIMKMKNLRSLHIADVHLTSKQFASSISKLTHLTTLSFSWTWTSNAEADEVTDSSLTRSFSKLSHLNLYIATLDICPLDKITWMLQYCSGLEHLAILSGKLHSDVSHSMSRYNITVNIKDMKFAKLNSFILDMKNHTFPGLLEREFVGRLFQGLDLARLRVFWCSSKWKRDFHLVLSDDKSTDAKIEFLTVDTDAGRPCPMVACISSSVRQVSLSYTCELAISDYTQQYLPQLEKLSLTNLMPCHSLRHSEAGCLCNSDSCHHVIPKLLKEQKATLAGLKEFSYRTNGFTVKRKNSIIDVHLENGTLLSSIKFQQLTKLALPLCGLLDTKDQANAIYNYAQWKHLKDSLPKNEWKKRVSHGSRKQHFSSAGFSNFTSTVPSLEHLELLPCTDSLCSSAGAEGVLEATKNCSKLKTLIIVKVPVNFNGKSLLLDIFSNCHELEHLHISSLVCDVQKLCRDLSLGLERATSLKILKVFQSQLTQFSKILFESVIKGCVILEQLVLIDTSRAFMLQKFPIAKLIEVAQMEKLAFLYVCSELITVENIKKLKSEVRKIAARKPFLISRLQKEFVREKSAFYHLEDLSGLPMVYHRAVANIDSLATGYCSNSSVANVTIEDVF